MVLKISYKEFTDKIKREIDNYIKNKLDSFADDVYNSIENKELREIVSKDIIKKYIKEDIEHYYSIINNRFGALLYSLLNCLIEAKEKYKSIIIDEGPISIPYDINNIIDLLEDAGDFELAYKISKYITRFVLMWDTDIREMGYSGVSIHTYPERGIEDIHVSTRYITNLYFEKDKIIFNSGIVVYGINAKKKLYNGSEEELTESMWISSSFAFLDF